MMATGGAIHTHAEMTALVQSLEKPAKYAVRSRDVRDALGRGGFGTVLIGEELETGAEVAIKRHRSPDGVKFANEAMREVRVSKAMRALEPENVMIMIDSFFENFGTAKYHCVVFPLMDMDLHTFMKHRKYIVNRKCVGVTCVDSPLINPLACPRLSSESAMLSLEGLAMRAVPRGILLR